MPNLTIQMTDAELYALDLIAVDKQEWADNVLTNRARVAVEELKQTPEWTQAVANTVTAGGDVTDDSVVLLQGKADNLFRTAAQKQAETLPDVPVEADPLKQRLTKRQIIGALISPAMLDPNASIVAAIKLLPDPVQRAMILNDWYNAPWYARDADMFNSPILLSALGFTSAEVDQLWIAGTKLPQ